MNLPKKIVKQGFTLIEILLVVAILSILLVVVFASLNPARRLAESRNANRYNAVNQLLTAMHECLVDNNGTYATCGLTADGTTREIVNTGVATACNAVCTTGAGSIVAATGDCAPLQTTLVTGLGYLGSLPTDPGGVTTGHTEYTVKVTTTGIVTVDSCSAEGVSGGTAPDIAVSR